MPQLLQRWGWVWVFHLLGRPAKMWGVCQLHSACHWWMLSLLFWLRGLWQWVYYALRIIKTCLHLGLVCWESGLCYGDKLLNLEASTEIECRDQCRDDNDCNWFTFDEIDHFCFLYDTCEEIDEPSCISCVSGEEACGPRPGRLM